MTTLDAASEAFFAAPEYTMPRPIPFLLDDPMANEGPGAAAPGSSVWWIKRLGRRMEARNVTMRRMLSWYEGTNDTWLLADRAYRDTFGTTWRNRLRANLAQPVVEIPEQRMTVNGIDIWDDDAGSEAAWDIWQRNQLDAKSSEAHLRVLSVGECPLIVSPDQDTNLARITIEDPLEVIVECDPTNDRRVTAALKMYVQEDGRWIAVLYRPFRTEVWMTRRGDSSRREWEPVDGLTTLNPFGVVPVVMLRNAPRAKAEHEGVISQLEQYAAALYRMATAAQHLAFPQRWMAGVTVEEEEPELDANGEPTKPAPAALQGGPDISWSAENPDAKFGSFATTDLLPFIRQLDNIRGDIGTITSTPHRDLLPPPTSVPPTGESVKFQDARLTRKVRRKMTTVGDGWEDAIRLAFLVEGDRARANRMDLEVSWEDPELQSEATHTDALVKLAGLGVPKEEIWRRAGATPQQVRRWSAAAAEPTEPTPPTLPATQEV